MHSHWQLKMEHDFTQAISDMGDEKEPTLQLCMSSEIVKLTIVGMCMMSIRQWCYRKTKEVTWQIGNDGLDPMCLQQGRMCQWQTILMQPGEIEDEKHTSCVA